MNRQKKTSLITVVGNPKNKETDYMLCTIVFEVLSFVGDPVYENMENSISWIWLGRDEFSRAAPIPDFYRCYWFNERFIFAKI